MLGEITREENKNLKDLSLREILVLLPLIFFIVQIGVYPKPFLSRMDASVKHLVAQVELKTGKRAIKKDKMAYVVDSDKIRQEH
jgi:NADH-quinone oxidoreductase subunit M